jgi:hypothetical protein
MCRYSSLVSARPARKDCAHAASFWPPPILAIPPRPKQKVPNGEATTQKDVKNEDSSSEFIENKGAKNCSSEFIENKEVNIFSR